VEIENILVWVSRHPLSQDQLDLIASKSPIWGNTEIVQYGDIDVFDQDAINTLMDVANGYNLFPIIGGVHGILGAVALQHNCAFLAFNNVNRAPVGATPDFKTTDVRVIWP
jgi:hypothetical protein